MSIMQRLTLIGMVNYDPTLFDGLTLPEEYDKNIFIESLLLEHGEKLVLYSDVDFMKYSIGAWGRKWSLELSRIAQALFAEYNPIWNYDRYEEINDVNNKTHDATESRDGDSTSETSGSGSATARTDTTNDSASNSNTSATVETNTTGTSDTASNSNGETDSTTSKTGSTESDSTTNKNHTNSVDLEVVNENITDASTEHQISADNSSTYQPERKDITNIGKQKESTDGAKDDIEENITSHETGSVQEDSTSNETTQSNSVEHGDTSSNSVENSDGQTNAVESSSGSSATTESNNSGSSTTSHDEGTAKASEQDNFVSNHNGHMWGNIGVTTSASMVTEVIEQRMKYNLYNVASRLFANELLIGIY